MHANSSTNQTVSHAVTCVPKDDINLRSDTRTNLVFRVHPGSRRPVLGQSLAERAPKDRVRQTKDRVRAPRVPLGPIKVAQDKARATLAQQDDLIQSKARPHPMHVSTVRLASTKPSWAPARALPVIVAPTSNSRPELLP